MDVRLNGEPFEGVDHFKSLGSQVAADGLSEMVIVHKMKAEFKPSSLTTMMRV